MDADDVGTTARAHARARLGADAPALVVRATQRLAMPGAPDRWMASLAGDGVAVVLVLDERGGVLACTANATDETPRLLAQR
jgi:hypothetical protein